MNCRDYTIQQLLGKGSYGQTYLITDKENTSKVIKTYLTGDGLSGIADSIAEIGVLFGVKNPNLIPGFNLVMKKSCPQLFPESDSVSGVMIPYLNGGDISKIIDIFSNSLNDVKGLPYGREVDIKDLGLKIVDKLIYQLTSAVSCLGNAGYYNFDIKPENVLYQISSDDGLIHTEFDINFWLGDYGLCLPIRRWGEPVSSKRLVSSPIVTPPEALEVNGEYTHKSMSWAIGLTVFSVMSGTDLERLVTMDNPNFDYSKFREMIKQNSPEISRYISNLLDQFNNYLGNYPLIFKISSILKRMITPIVDDRADVDDILIEYPNLLPCDFSTVNGLEIISVSASTILKVLNRMRDLYSTSRYSVFCLTLSLCLRYLELNPKDWEETLRLSHIVASYYYAVRTGIVPEDVDKLVRFLITLKGVIYINPLYNNSNNSLQLRDVLNKAYSYPQEFKQFLLDGCPYQDDENEDFATKTVELPVLMTPSPLISSRTEAMVLPVPEVESTSTIRMSRTNVLPSFSPKSEFTTYTPPVPVLTTSDLFPPETKRSELSFEIEPLTIVGKYPEERHFTIPNLKPTNVKIIGTTFEAPGVIQPRLASSPKVLVPEMSMSQEEYFPKQFNSL